MQTFSNQPLRRVEERADDPLDRSVWPATLPPVRQVLTEGLDFGAVTVFVGDNGAGKSTLVEAIAMAFGLNAEGGSTSAMNHTRDSESALGDHLQLVRGAGASKKGYFLRAETMHGFFTYLESIGDGQRFHERSHGESFLDLVMSRSRVRGLWMLERTRIGIITSWLSGLDRFDAGARRQWIADHPLDTFADSRSVPRCRPLRNR